MLAVLHLRATTAHGMLCPCAITACPPPCALAPHLPAACRAPCTSRWRTGAQSSPSSKTGRSGASRCALVCCADRVVRVVAAQMAGTSAAGRLRADLLQFLVAAPPPHPACLPHPCMRAPRRPSASPTVRASAHASTWACRCGRLVRLAGGGTCSAEAVPCSRIAVLAAVRGVLACPILDHCFPWPQRSTAPPALLRRPSDCPSPA